MLSRFLQAFSIFVALAATTVAEDDRRPVCDAQNVGRMWPDEANYDPAALNRLARCGQLSICRRGVWHYRWYAPVVRVDQLRDGAAAKNIGVCEQPPATEQSKR